MARNTLRSLYYTKNAYIISEKSDTSVFKSWRVLTPSTIPTVDRRHSSYRKLQSTYYTPVLFILYSIFANTTEDLSHPYLKFPTFVFAYTQNAGPENIRRLYETYPKNLPFICYAVCVVYELRELGSSRFVYRIPNIGGV